MRSVLRAIAVRTHKVGTEMASSKNRRLCMHACLKNNFRHMWQIPKYHVGLKAPVTSAVDDKFLDIFSNFQKNKVYFMRIVCQQTILMKYVLLFRKRGKI